MPILRRRTLLTLPILTAAGLPALAACGSRSSETSGADASASPSQQTGTPPPGGWQTVESFTAGHHISVDVAPLVTMDEKTTILPLRITRMADDAATDDVDEDNGTWGWTHLWKAPGLLDNRAAAGTRLIDTAGRRVWNCIDGTIPTEARSLEKGQSGMAYAVFGPVDTDRVTVFLPLTGFPEVAVISKDEAAGILGSDVDLDKALAEVDVASYDSKRQDDQPTLAEISAPASIDTFTRAFDKSSASRTTDTSITTTLASDVTFEFGKYDLTAQADTQLQTVAAQLASYSGGELSIVGHTDDVADEAFNQTSAPPPSTPASDSSPPSTPGASPRRARARASPPSKEPTTPPEPPTAASSSPSPPPEAPRLRQPRPPRPPHPPPRAGNCRRPRDPSAQARAAPSPSPQTMAPSPRRSRSNRSPAAVGSSWASSPSPAIPRAPWRAPGSRTTVTSEAYSPTPVGRTATPSPSPDSTA